MITQLKSTTRTYGADGPSMATAGYRANRRITPATLARVTPAAWGLALTEAAIGYEWLLSGLNKLLSPDFSTGLAHELQSDLDGNPNSWYVSLAKTVFIPNAHLLAPLVELGELLVGGGLFVGAFLWLSGRFPVARWARLLNLGVIMALLGGILMSVNYAVMGGDTLPGINPGNPFNEGLSIDSLLAMIGIGLLVIHVLAARVRR
jgi:thiosulfate dehydrogenase [quinone] large subunit